MPKECCINQTAQVRIPIPLPQRMNDSLKIIFSLELTETNYFSFSQM